MVIPSEAYFSCPDLMHIRGQFYRHKFQITVVKVDYEGGILGGL